MAGEVWAGSEDIAIAESGRIILFKSAAGGRHRFSLRGDNTYGGTTSSEASIEHRLDFLGKFSRGD